MAALQDLMLRFAALGDNCEFGLVQRQAGAEPLGLLRFAGFHIPAERRLGRLIEALDREFEGVGRPETVRVGAAGVCSRVMSSVSRRIAKQPISPIRAGSRCARRRTGCGGRHRWARHQREKDLP